MATVRTTAAGGSSTGTSDRTVSLATAVGDLIVVICQASANTNATPTCSDNGSPSLGYTRVGVANNGPNVNTLSIFVANAKETSAQTRVITVATGSNTSGTVIAYAIAGMSQVGSAAIKQSNFQTNQAAGGTPAPAFSAAAKNGNLVIGTVANQTNPATMTPPTGTTPTWTEDQDVGQASPAEGVETIHANFGFTGTTLTWGSTSASVFCAAIVELDSAITPTVATELTLASSAPPLSISLIPSAGSLTLTGFAPTIPAQNTQITPTVGSVSLTGNDLTQNITITPSAGSVTASGQTPTVPVEALLTPSTAGGSPQFDMGLDFRGTAGFVTDPLYGAPVLGETFPHTYINGNGQSVNAGWSTSANGPADRAVGNDPRIAGVNAVAVSGKNFKVDLSSGSGRGAGPYIIDEAHGDPTIGALNQFELRDNATVLATFSLNTEGGGRFQDATTDLIAASTVWYGARVPFAFASTSLIVAYTGTSTNSRIAHLRITFLNELTLNGNRPGVVQTTVLTPSAGSLTLTGNQPIIQMSVVPSAGSVTITGDTSALSVSLIPNVGSLTLTGQTPTLTTATLITPNAGSLTLTGQTPTLLGTEFITPNAGSLTLTGQQVTVSTGATTTNITPNAGSLTLTGGPTVLAFGIVIGTAVGSGGIFFDMGFDFRATTGFVTDPAFGVPALGEIFPHTYTNANGDSVNAGWDSHISGGLDRLSTNDARLAGANYDNTEHDVATLTIDLSSGSVPGAGDYAIDLAAGDALVARGYDSVTVKDNTTTLITFSGTNSAANDFFDATGTSLGPFNSGAAWTGTPVTKTFATTTAKFSFAGLGGAGLVAHFRLTKAGGSGSSLDVTGQTPTEILTTVIQPNAGSSTIAGQTPTQSITITPGSGTLTLTGFPPSLGNNPNIAPSSGTLTLTGNQPTLQMSVVPSAGSVTITGNAPALSVSLIPNAGSLTLIGQTPTLAVTTLITPNVGSLTLTGNQPTLRVSTFITPNVGSLTLTEQTPAITQETRITPNVGSLTLTGNQPTLRVSTFITPSAGSLTLTGEPVVVQQGSPGNITPNTGDVSITGNQPTQNLGDFVTVGSASLTGNQPTVARVTLVTTNTGSVSTTGNAATLALGIVSSAGSATATGGTPTQSIRVFTNTGSLTLTGQTPIVLSGSFVTLNAGAVNLTGFQPIIGSSPFITPDAGALALVGFAPLVEEQRLNITPNTVTLSLVGYQPDVERARIEITPDTGSLAVQGYAPVVQRRRVKIIKFKTVVHPTFGIRTRIPRRGIVRR